MGAFYSQLFVTPEYPTTSFADRTVIVTGSNVGIGFEAAKHFVRLNAAKVVLAVRNVSAGEAAKELIEKSTARAGVCEIWELDLASFDSVREFAERALKLPRLDIVVENAGIATSVFNVAEGHERTITRFIPCEYGANIEDHPDVPFFHWETREPIRKALREQTEIEWTLVNIGWLVDYVVPRRNRYLKEPGETFPVNVEEKRLVIPGTGKESVDVTAARDVAAALALLAKAPSWEPYTYISGKKTCWNELAELVQRRYPGTWDVRRLGLGRILETIQISTDKREVIIAHYQLITPLGAGDFHALKVEDHRRKFFPELVFRSPEQLIDEIEESWNKIV